MKNIQNMMKQAQQLQTKMADMQAKLAEVEMTGEAGAGMVSVTLNGTLIGSTSTQQDTLTPQWNEYLTAVIPGGSTFRVDVLDEDLTVDDPMFACATLPTLSAANIRAYVNTCSSAAGTPAGPGRSIAFWFEAQ